VEQKKLKWIKVGVGYWMSFWGG